MEPAVNDHGVGGFGLTPVTGHHHVAARYYFADLLAVRSHVLAFVVNDAQFDVEHAVTGARLHSQLLFFGPIAHVWFDFRDGQERRGFGQAVNLNHLPAQTLLHRLDQGHRRRRTGGSDSHAFARQRGELRFTQAVIHSHVDHRRRHAGERHSLARRQVEEARGFVLFDDDVFRADTGHGVRQSPAVAVKLRQRVQINIVVRQSEFDDRIYGVDVEIAMR
ncbi:MAG: hypothetical protein JMDDDDMK_05520 [Acidobacteria bacterium]|nr:hypothetical protein [Acidobacteriota bacterium]